MAPEAFSDSYDWRARAQTRMTPNYAPMDFLLSRGEGSFVWDEHGKRYLDFSSGIGVSALGHGHPAVMAAINEQLGRFSHTSNQYFHRGYLDLSERLSQLCFGERFFLSNSGSEAMEAALKLARRHHFLTGETQRQRFVATHGSFHGRTMGAVSITGQPKYQEGFGQMLQDVSFVPFGDLAAAEEAVAKPDVAAFVVEPVQGNSGVYPASPAYLQGLRKACDHHGVLLIFDEIQTGIARTGAWFSYQHSDISPDLMTLAKALGGGLPLGAMVATEAVGQSMTLGCHGSTFGGNPVACAAGLATLDTLDRDGIKDAVGTKGDRFVAALQQNLQIHPEFVALRHQGLMIGLELKGPAKALRDACQAAGLLGTLAGNHVLRLLPPLNASDAELDEAVSLLTQAMENYAP